MKEQIENLRNYLFKPDRQIGMIKKIDLGFGDMIIPYCICLVYFLITKAHNKIEHIYLYFSLIFIILSYLRMLPKNKKNIYQILIDTVNQNITISYYRFVVFNYVVKIDFNQFSYRYGKKAVGSRVLNTLEFFSDNEFVGYLFEKNKENWPDKRILEILHKLRELKLKEIFPKNK